MSQDEAKLLTSGFKLEQNLEVEMFYKDHKSFRDSFAKQNCLSFSLIREKFSSLFAFWPKMDMEYLMK